MTNEELRELLSKPRKSCDGCDGSGWLVLHFTDASIPWRCPKCNPSPRPVFRKRGNRA
jgi:hypothetical protein